MNLIDRQDALRLFDQVMRGASSGQGGVIVVKGATALGKSALLHAFHRRGEELGAVVVSATAAPAERELPSGVLSQLVRAVAVGRDERASVASLALAVPGGAADLRPVSRSAVRVDLPALDAMCTALLELSADQPLLISVDDVEHTDAESRRALLFLARRVHFARIALVVSHTDRGGYAEHGVAADLARQSDCHTVHLAPLSKKGVRDLACDLAGREAGERLHLPWLRLSGGNPLLVAALAEDHRDRLRATDDDRSAAAVAIAAARYGQAVLSCVHRGGEQVIKVARGLAVLGGEDGLGDLVDLRGDQLARSLHALAAAGVTAGGTFRAEAARGAVLGDMSAEECGDLHRAAAEVTHRRGMSTGVVAEHLTHAGRETPGWGMTVLEDAAAHALCEGRADRAIAYLRQALSGCADDRRRNEITIKLVRAEWCLNPAVAVDRLDELAEAARRGVMTGGYAVALVRALLWHGQSDQARKVLDTVLRSEVEHECTAHEVVVLRDWMRCTHPLEVSPRLHELPAGQDNRATTSVAALRRLDAAKLLADVLTGGDRSDLTARADQILRGCRPDVISFDAIVWTLHSLTYGDRLEQAQAWWEAVTAMVDAERAPNWSARLAGIRSEIAVRRGDMATAERQARTALALVPPAGWGVAIAEPLSTLIVAYTATGQHEAAADQLGLPVPEAMFETRFGLQYLHARGRHSLATGNGPLALRDFRLCGELMGQWRMDMPAFVPWRADAAEAYLRMGRPEDARPLLEAQLTRCGPASPRAEGRTLRLLAATREPHQRPVLLHRATDLSQAGGDRYEMAQALHDLAQAYRALGEYRRAATIARRARVVTPESAEAQVITPLPTPPATHDADVARHAATLSDAERRVAVLAALGYSNREIAEKLWITVSTVEQHLTRAYRKLDVTRRSDLPAGLKALA
ncbi:AAA family ATPase [Phytohabitans sp. LJ34]|uniref:AAA family ATPase n=1 Tax=Phytohabitans sp. LJ34 TaxID=3452217 RepID=UPI003F8BB521